MGGKTWSKEEERLFWEVIVPRSPVAAYPDPKNSLNWAQLAEWMNELAGDKRRREYTHTMLCRLGVLLYYCGMDANYPR